MATIISLRETRSRRLEMVLEELESRPLTWSELRAMLSEIGEVVEEPYGILRIIRKHQSLVLRSTLNGTAVPAAQLVRIRQFIEDTQGAPPRVSRAGDWLVVIDHLEASVFRFLDAAEVPQLVRCPPPDGRAAKPTVKRVNTGEGFVPPGFFAPLAGALRCARRILIIGGEKTLGGEAERFIAWLRGYRPELAQRIVATLAVEPHEFTEAGLAAKARDFFVQLDARCAGDEGVRGAAG